jgi:uncharacterized protein involved in exopolysaccharide biosynthesis
VFENRAEMTPDHGRRTDAETDRDRQQRRPQRGDLIEVGFEARSGQIAADVVNEYVTRIMAANVELRPGAPKARSNSSNKRWKGCPKSLESAAPGSAGSRPRTPMPSPMTRPFRFSRQAVLQERLASAQRELSSLIDQRARIIEVYEATGQIAATDHDLTDDQRQLRNLERELAQQLSIYSEDAPQIVTLRRRIETLREQVAANTR